MESSLLNSRFTWYGPNGKQSKLDRVLLNAEWAFLGNWSSTALPRRNSDHRPLVTKYSNQNWGPLPFKFFNCWLEDEVLVEQLKAAWKTSNDTNIHSKLKIIKVQAKEWKLSTFGDLDNKIKGLEEKQTMADETGIDCKVKLEIR